MFSSAAAALSQMFDARFRGVLALGIGGTIALFFGLLFGLQWIVSSVPDFGLSWVQEAYRIISASLLTIAFIFLGVPVALTNVEDSLLSLRIQIRRRLLRRRWSIRRGQTFCPKSIPWSPP